MAESIRRFIGNRIAAYFDGDGSVSIRVRKFTLTFSLEFSESYLPQLVQVRAFLTAEGISTRPIEDSSIE